MSARRKSHKVNAKFILTLILIAIIVTGIIFAIDIFAQKTGTNNEITQTAHTVRLEIEEALGIPSKGTDPSSEAAPSPEAEHPLSPVSEPVSENTDDGLIHFAEYFELPVCAASETGTAPDHQIRRFGNFVICYRESYEQAEWAAYCLENSELEKNASRGNDFRPDPEITTGSASLADYKKSGYDRGHLAPAADFAFSEEAMSESFYLSNMSPQAPGLNREIWQYLEGQVRVWAKKYGRVYVVTGPVLEKPADQYDYIGANKVSVPEYYYKVILAPLYENEEDAADPENCKNLKAIGFILPNQKCPDTFWDYAVTIDEVERRTGIDFFALLEDTLEKRIEGSHSCETETWK